jgi:phosphatidylglycerol---prolipoprotein diacylglyceryl transferase
MLPFIRVADIKIPLHIPSFDFGPIHFPGIPYLPIHMFGVLVASGVILGTSITIKRGRERGLDVGLLNSFITWILVCGFVGAHLFNEFAYEWDKVVANPIVLLKLWEGIASFGGFLGAFVGAMLWKYLRATDPLFEIGAGITIYKLELRKQPLPVFPFCDLIISVFPVAWIFGRAGCSSAHDHIGAIAPQGVAIAVAAPFENVGRLTEQYAGPPWFDLLYGDFPRYDLGLLEMLFTVFLAGFIALTWKRKLPTGMYVATICMAYAPVRYAMETLRLEQLDVRYNGLTPAQWMCIVLFGVGVAGAVAAYRNAKSKVDPLDVFRLGPGGVSTLS